MGIAPPMNRAGTPQTAARKGPQSQRRLRQAASRILPSALLLALAISTSPSTAQTPYIAATTRLSNNLLGARSFFHTYSAEEAAPGTVAPPAAEPRQQPHSFRPLSQLAIAARIGINGAGLDIATPLGRRFNLRAGGSFLPVSASFQEQGINVGVKLHMLSAHTALDWFPFNGGFHLSPQLVFANNNRLLATADVPSGNTIRINGGLYSSSYTDPLHGSGRIDFRKVSPGLSLGFGNILPRKHGRFSMPVELGVYYAGKPTLQLNFTGSACDPAADTITCVPAATDPGFQQNLAAAIARRDHYLNDTRFFPIFSIGIAYRLW